MNRINELFERLHRYTTDAAIWGEQMDEEMSAQNGRRARDCENELRGITEDLLAACKAILKCDAIDHHSVGSKHAWDMAREAVKKAENEQ